jgi:hypothetical protein
MVRHLFHSLSLAAILNGNNPSPRDDQPLAKRVFPLVAKRLTRPGSEHALAAWLENRYVITAQGCRWMLEWKPLRRVMASFEQLRL